MSKKKLRAIIVDDELYSRAELKHLLSSHSSIIIIAEADSGEKGLEKALTQKPDIIFVDIEMSDMSGMEMVAALENMKNPPKVVFATAYSEYAVKAFRYGAVDYLLKPFSADEVEETVQRLEKLLLSGDTDQIQESKERAIGKLAVEEEGKIVYLAPNKIIYCTHQHRETIIYTKQQSYQSRKTLKELESKLKGYSFYRTHKSFLVNLKEIEQLVPWFNGAFELKLNNVEENIPVSRNYVKELREQLEL
ncbi:LytR/AlgR family response regulator transcription factor [Virgibacillus necropolis]|uniref:DNA-binding response regulator n=1 Tax=Virgibacillus necropolis TaxID=163877 RepID=A0A221MGH7_9BACI|nr:LytTR family DNA-binding domain-containing protein [Virgibacillus necropolis]ASN06763.1 DNA-binding response regulator [Virgibacillus necropolis]